MKLTVGSLRGIPQWASNAAPTGVHAATIGGRLRPDAPPPPRANLGVPHPAPVKLGRGCCRSMCFGCPWADMVRRRGQSGG